MSRRLTALGLAAALLFVGCTAQSFVARGDLNGFGWTVSAAPMGDDICLSSTTGTTCLHTFTEPRWQIDSSSISIAGSGNWVTVGIARPTVATVRYADGDTTTDIATVPLLFRSDWRAFAYASNGDFSAPVVAIFDAQGNQLEDARLP